MSNFGRVTITSDVSGPDSPESANTELDNQGTPDQPSNQPSLESDQARETPPVSETPEESPKAERPEWLPEKFKSVEDLAKAYGELEKKNSKPKEEAPAEGESPKLDESVKEGEESPEPEKAPDASKVDLTPFHNEWAEKGELTAESFDKLETMGFPKELVQQYITGFQATQAQEAQTIYKETGGEDTYKAMTQWASQNLSQDEINSYDSLVTGGDINAAKIAAKGLYAQYVAANGQPPKLIGGQANGTSSVQAFRSTAEVVKAMSDPRYSNDPAFRKDVERRLEMSSVL
jgi:hypothetical protein